MKKLFSITLLILFASCGAKESENEEPANLLENLTYSVDTVVMDPGEDIFNLSMGIRSLDLSPDNKFLYYFENMPPKLLKVDLDKRSLVSKTEFESEGPNGVGVFVGTIQVGPEEKLVLLGNNASYGVFDMNGTKIKDLKTKPEGLDPNLAENFFNLYGNSIYDWENDKIFSWPVEREMESAGQKEGLVSIDLKSKSAKIIEVPEMEIVKKYSILFEENGASQGSPQEVYLTQHEGKILISCSAMGDFYVYDPKTDETKFIQIDHQLVPNRLTGEINNRPASQESFNEEMAKVNSQIYFQNLKWDPSREMYLRFARKVFMPKTPEEEFTFEYFLLAYDPEFNLLGETKLDLEERIDYHVFFKDDKLYSYVNVNDDLGFAVISFDF
ncbi:DUF4221 domain-containing protein [Algoriphagus machipongonensis]|uniref:Lipoprotein n=1 Tax=Algoriphagus machipongonensis TaxID=388413 RepID=A3HUB3_9BACT|nr:DUF4221 domain-containing protein [Algoriphagus machipongonensis]EAZ81735.1 hypothetical protein ALPR1_00800 [Algoriphagus machipongonensis]